MNSLAEILRGRLRDRLRDIGKRLDALSLKERALLVTSGLLVILFVWNQWFLDPLEARRKSLLVERDGLSEELARFDALTSAWSAAAEVDPDADRKQRIAELSGELQALSAAIEQRAGRMVSPAQVPEALRRVLAGREDVDFESLEGLATRQIVADAGDPAEAPATVPAVAQASYAAYRHGFRIRFRGSYRAITAYVKDLEQLPYGFFWDELNLDASEFPQLRGSLVVYTVSLDRGWIGV